MDSCVDWWNRKRAEIALLESGASLNEFYTWPPIVDTMWPNTDGYAVHQIKFLTELPDCESRWLMAMADKMKIPACQWWPNVSFASINHAYNLAHFEMIVGLGFDKIDYIFEFGAGTGNMCRIIYNLGFTGRYEICDFPEMQRLQRFFLTRSGIDVSNIHWMDSMEYACIPNHARSLIISIAAIEEAPQDIHALFIGIGKRCSYFLTGGCLFNGTHVKLRDETKHTTKWRVWDTLIPPGYYIGIGTPC